MDFPGSCTVNSKTVIHPWFDWLNLLIKDYKLKLGKHKKLNRQTGWQNRQHGGRSQQRGEEDADIKENEGTDHRWDPQVNTTNETEKDEWLSK